MPRATAVVNRADCSLRFAAVCARIGPRSDDFDTILGLVCRRSHYPQSAVKDLDMTAVMAGLLGEPGGLES